MAISKQSCIHFLKISLLALGVFSLTVAVSPYIFSYFDNKPEIHAIDNNEIDGITALTDEPIIETELTTEPPQKTTPIKVSTSNHSSGTETNKQYSETQQASKKMPLPELDQSDDFLLNRLTHANSDSLFVPIDIIRNIVVFVDNFSRGEVISRFSPLHKPGQPFVVEKKNGEMIIDSASYQRYDRYAEAVATLDTEQFIELYHLLNPLIDQAYQEIGYPAGSFNDTFITAIDQIIDTPIINYDLQVNSPAVMYQYVDENLESLPDSQKLMMRMGANNLQKVKLKMQDIQSELQRL